MTNSFTWNFDELPLLVTNGIDAALINGRIEICYAHSGAWHTGLVELEGYRHLTWAERDQGIKPWVFVRAPDNIAALIVQRLEGTWCDKVSDAVYEQLASDREAVANDYAEMRRNERMGR